MLWLIPSIVKSYINKNTKLRINFFFSILFYTPIALLLQRFSPDIPVFEAERSSILTSFQFYFLIVLVGSFILSLLEKQKKINNYCFPFAF